MAYVKKGGHGGARAGAGGAAADGAEIVARASVTLNQQSYDLLCEFGQGNDSVGFRRICEELATYRAGGAAVKTSAPKPAPKRKPPVYVAPPTHDKEGVEIRAVIYRGMEQKAQRIHDAAMEEFYKLRK